MKPHELFQLAMKESLYEAYGILLDFAKTEPEVFRRGQKAYAEPIVTVATLREEREELKGLDETEFAQRLKQREKETSAQETDDMLMGGRV